MVRLFNHWFPSNAVLHVAFDSVLLFVTFLLAAAWLTHGTPGIELLLPSAILFAVTTAALNTIIGVYQRNPYRTGMQTVARVMLSLLLSMPLAYGILYVLQRNESHQEALKVAALGALGVLALVRGYLTHWGRTPMFVRRVLVLGTGAEALAVGRSLNQFGPSMSVVGFYPASNPGEVSRHDVAGDKVFAPNLPLAETVRRHDIDDLIVAVRERRGGVLPLNDLLQCKLSGVRVLDLSSYYERALGQVRLDALHASWLIFGEGFRQGFLRTTVKRLFDVVVSTAVFVVTLPIMVATVIAIALEDGYPVLYRQPRIGQAGRVFDVVKFRSMRRNAEDDGKPRWASSNDDRVTRVGRIIRKLRIDELPQLINVLRGDMSLVGPRPERPFFVDRLTREVPFYAARHSVKPGVTGWAQVRYHYGASVDDSVQKLQYDLYYVKNHTLFLDLLILVETIGVVVTGKGAQ
jgi:sugar transferase (PEP-CTERM system associated)